MDSCSFKMISSAETYRMKADTYLGEILFYLKRQNLQSMGLLCSCVNTKGCKRKTIKKPQTLDSDSSLSARIQ